MDMQMVTDKVALSPIEDIIADARAGRMFILVDDENRENEGDLVIPADHADAHAINFMAKHGRGLICLSLTTDHVKRLGLPLMAQHNATRHQTAFTVSIEAREGVTTGISAADRAHTIKVASNPQARSSDIGSPGHVFPLMARDGGVLVRAGHTEAAVDIAHLAGLNPAGVICEIMNDDGTMARLPDLLQFAKTHDLKIATIADLISYRRRTERLVEKLLEMPFESQIGGEWTLMVYASPMEYAEHLVLVKGSPSLHKPTLVRMHALDVLADVLGDLHTENHSHLQRAMHEIACAGEGVLVLLRPPHRTAVSERLMLRAKPDAKPSRNLRDYGIGAQILVDLGIHEMTLLTNSPRTIIGLEGYGLKVVGYHPIPKE